MSSYFCVESAVLEHTDRFGAACDVRSQERREVVSADICERAPGVDRSLRRIEPGIEPA